MIQSTDLKNGTTFLSSGKPYKVLKYNFVKVGRGGATVRVTAKDLISGTVEDKTFSSNVKVEEVTTFKKKLQYLYSDNTNVFFVDPKTFDQVEISADVLKEELPYLKEGEEVNILYWADKTQDKPISVEIPLKVTLKITDTAPGVKGNSATNMYKSAILENGLTVRVPLFINQGDLIIVDTRNGEYVERAK